MSKGTLNETGVRFNSGEKLSSSKLNTLNTTINKAVDVINSDLLQGVFNVNLETGDFDKTYTLAQAISYVPDSRKSLGLILRFLEDVEGDDEEDTLTKAWIEYAYLGDSLEDWKNESLWQANTFDIIDGGEW